jgi:hypothetical protein
VIVFDGEALCAACDAGTHPPLPDDTLSNFRCSVVPVLRGSKLAQSLLLNIQQPIEEKSMKVTPEMKQAIRDADPRESCRSIGQRLGLSGSAVDYHRGLLGKVAKSKKPAKAKDKDKKPAKATDTSASRIGPGHALANTAQATFIVTDAIVDAWWKGLTLGDKAALFARNYVIRVEGSIQ